MNDVEDLQRRCKEDAGHDAKAHEKCNFLSFKYPATMSPWAS